MRSESDSHINTGGCGALYIKYQRCPATAAPFESALARAPRRAKGKGVKRSSRRLRSSQSPKKSRRAKGKGLAERSGSEQSEANPSQHCQKKDATQSLLVAPFQWPRRAFYNLYLKYSKMFPLICISEISHSLVLYSAVRIRSSASRRLFCASRISIPGKSPSR